MVYSSTNGQQSIPNPCLLPGLYLRKSGVMKVTEGLAIVLTANARNQRKKEGEPGASIETGTRTMTGKSSSYLIHRLLLCRPPYTPPSFVD